MFSAHSRQTDALTAFNNNGSLDACRNCSGSKCCGNIRHGGTIEPPFLTSFDVERIARFAGLKPDDFSDEIVNPHTGNPVRFLKTTSKEGCHFLEAGRCNIHDLRPIDCRLFPLDVKQVASEMKWVIYDYRHCELTKRDIGLLMEQRAPALELLGGELLDYATVPTPGMMEIQYKVIAPVDTSRQRVTA